MVRSYPMCSQDEEEVPQHSSGTDISSNPVEAKYQLPQIKVHVEFGDGSFSSKASRQFRIGDLKGKFVLQQDIQVGESRDRMRRCHGKLPFVDEPKGGEPYFFHEFNCSNVGLYSVTLELMMQYTPVGAGDQKRVAPIRKALSPRVMMQYYFDVLPCISSPLVLTCKPPVATIPWYLGSSPERCSLSSKGIPLAAIDCHSNAVTVKNLQHRVLLSDENLGGHSLFNPFRFAVTVHTPAQDALLMVSMFCTTLQTD